MLTLVIVMGLDQPVDGEWLGLKQFAQWMKSIYGCEYVGFTHDDLDLQSNVESIKGKRILIGHSFGGYECFNMLDNGLEVESAVFLDPKPKPFFQWINPFFQFDTPENALVYKDYYGTFGCAIEKKENSEKLNIKHDQFPGSPIVHAYIESEIQRLKDNIV